MSFILYVVVLVVSVSSVMMGLDWLSAPPPPVPKSVQTVSAPAKPAAPVVASKTAPTKPDSKQAAVAGADAAKSASSPSTPSKAASPTTGAAQSVAAVQPPTAAAPQAETAGSAPANAADGTTIITGNDGEAAQAATPLCDVQACTARYISFRASDCTWQPYEGPRRLCKVGNPPKQASDKPAADVQTSDASQQPAAPAACNYDACAAAYHSFDPATCTWQPYEGPRRLCKK